MIRIATRSCLPIPEIVTSRVTTGLPSPTCGTAITVHGTYSDASIPTILETGSALVPPIPILETDH